ncbi:MAG: type II toxin-antitoxin system MqsA family antitoxin [Steroidobacteraceae bacterium]
MGSSPNRSLKSARAENSASSPFTGSTDRCAWCGRPGVQLLEVSRTYGRGRTMLVVEGIPMFSCPNCRESYFTAQTLHKLERIKAARKSVAARRVSVALFEKRPPP